MWRIVLVLCLLLVACQCQRASPRAEPQAPEVAAAVPLKLASFTPADANAHVYLDLGYLGPSALDPLIQQSQAIPGFGDALVQIEKQCGFRPWLAVEEAALFATIESVNGRAEPSGVSLVIRAKNDPPALVKCLAAVVGSPDTPTVNGYTNLGGVVVGVSGQFIVLGADEKSIEKVLASAGKVSKPSAEKPRPKASIYATFIGTAAPLPLDANVVIGPADQRSKARASVRFASVEDATAFETTARQFVDAVVASNPLTDPAVRAQFSKGFTAARTAETVELSLDLEGVELAMLGTVSALSIYGVRKYVINAKTAEARYTLGEIAKGLSSWFANESIERINAGSKEPVRFPPSTPQVPAEVPSGRRVLSPPDSWSHETWRAADFAPQEATHYAYQVITAPDRRSVVIRATGDLDGDGVKSTFEFGLKIVLDGEDEIVVVDEEMREALPDE